MDPRGSVQNSDRDKVKLADVIKSSIPRGEEEVKWRNEMFGKVRILVTGRSGAGKSTLLRLVVGADGPQTISYGMAGEQDIKKEYHYKPEHGIPLIFHDTNGIDVHESNFQIIKKFLQDHQESADFSEHVHALWYVASACDDRIKEDRGLLKELISGFDIPLLVVLTHTDEVQDTKKEKAMRALRELIDEAASMIPSIVPVGNDVEFRPEDNCIIVKRRDAQGLQLVSSSTYNLLGNEQMRATWAASQADHIHMKLELSAQKIAGYALRSALSSPAAIVPYTDIVKIPALFSEIFWSLCTIWEVPKPLEEVLSKNVLRKERNDALLRSIANDTIMVATMAATVLATVASAGSALVAILPPALAIYCGGSAVVNVRTVTIIMKAFALQVLANILYVKRRQESKHRWDPTLTQSNCQTLCHQLLQDAELKNDLKQFVEKSHSRMDTVLISRKELVEGILKWKMLTIFEGIWRDRPTSFASVSEIRRG